MSIFILFFLLEISTHGCHVWELLFEKRMEESGGRVSFVLEFNRY